MLSKNEIKYIQSLCQKKQRQAEGLFVAEGFKLVNELIASSYRIKKIYATIDWNAPVPPTIEVVRIALHELEKISSLQTPSQVLAVVEQQAPPEAPVLKNTLSLVLDGIQDPGNLGTIIRIADWFGISQVIASEDTVELYNPKVIQATMGSFLRVQLWYRSLAVFLKGADIPVYGALLNGDDLYRQAPVKEGLLVIGNESKGIRDELLPMIQHAITIPRKGGAESLNAGVATGILLSHLTR